ncbi:DUF3168 domain-containing protein [Sphingomonas sp. LH128]|uniref:DUF3168 domain-containing protein n=1 Tax=Sphingomonas sp. LH128 TaxID=473781 RepID=UPI002E13D8DF
MPVAQSVDRRVDWGVRPQGTALPAIVIERTFGTPQMNFNGPAGWIRDRIQIECWGRTYKVAKDLALSIGGDGGLLVGFRGDHLGVRLRTFVLGIRSDYDTDDQGVAHRTILDVMVLHIRLS